MISNALTKLVEQSAFIVEGIAHQNKSIDTGDKNKRIVIFNHGKYLYDCRYYKDDLDDAEFWRNRRNFEFFCVFCEFDLVLDYRFTSYSSNIQANCLAQHNLDILSVAKIFLWLSI